LSLAATKIMVLGENYTLTGAVAEDSTQSGRFLK